MTDRKLYALTDSEASELRQIVDQAQSQALTDQDGFTYEDLTHLMVPLNTPLDRDAAVERMARAAAADLFGADLWDLLELNGTPAIARDHYRGKARLALEALLQVDRIHSVE